MRAKFINEKFTEKSDPIRDMGIGAKPDDVLQEFLIDFVKEFKIEPYVDNIEHTYDTHEEVFVIEGQYKEKDHPINRLLGGEEGDYELNFYELNFTKTDKAANAILKGAKWGFFYWNKGKVTALKSKDLHGVIKEILKIRKIQRRTLDKMIKTYQSYVSQVEKIKEILNESR